MKRFLAKVWLTFMGIMALLFAGYVLVYQVGWRGFLGALAGVAIFGLTWWSFGVLEK
jgi:hypothetical protein